MSFSIEALLGLSKDQRGKEQRIYSTNFIPAKCFSWKHMESVIKKTDEWDQEKI